jgi:hypothetical protein
MRDGYGQLELDQGSVLHAHQAQECGSLSCRSAPSIPQQAVNLVLRRPSAQLHDAADRDLAGQPPFPQIGQDLVEQEFPEIQRISFLTENKTRTLTPGCGLLAPWL